MGLLGFISIWYSVISSIKQRNKTSQQAMSHLIQTTDKMEAKCILSIPCKQVVTPKYRQLLRSSMSLAKQAEQECEKEEVIMRKLCQKLAERELTKLQQQNEANLKKQFNKIKRRMKASAQRDGHDSEVTKYLDGYEKSQDLSSLLKNRSECPQIRMKYQSKLMNKMFSLKEAKQIDQEKQNYRRWVNTCNNSPLKSPNYNKMNYVLEKLSRKKQMTQIFANAQTANIGVGENGTIKNKSESSVKQVRATEQLGFSQMTVTPGNKADYSPKSKCPAFLRRLR